MKQPDDLMKSLALGLSLMFFKTTVMVALSPFWIPMTIMNHAKRFRDRNKPKDDK